MGEGGEAFVKGGFGCIAAFIVLAVVTVLVGGTVTADLGGLLLLFVIGGLLGLLYLAVKRRGRREAAVIGPGWVCPSCAALNGQDRRHCGGIRPGLG